MAYWISHRVNVLFRYGPGVGISSAAKSAFDQSGLRWRALAALNGESDQTLSDDTVEAVLIDGIDRVPKKIRRAVLDMLRERPSRKIVWATVTVLDEDDFDLEMTDTEKVEDFDILVDVPCSP